MPYGSSISMPASRILDASHCWVYSTTWTSPGLPPSLPGPTLCYPFHILPHFLSLANQGGRFAMQCSASKSFNRTCKLPCSQLDSPSSSRIDPARHCCRLVLKQSLLKGQAPLKFKIASYDLPEINISFPSKPHYRHSWILSPLNPVNSTHGCMLEAAVVKPFGLRIA